MINHLTVVPENYDSDDSDSETENNTHARQKVVLYVPDDVDNRRRDAVMARLADEYGGFTVTRVHGGWLDANDFLVEEEVLKVEAIRMDDNAPKANVIAESCADWLQSHTDEEVVMWEVDDVQAGME